MEIKRLKPILTAAVTLSMTLSLLAPVASAAQSAPSSEADRVIAGEQETAPPLPQDPSDSRNPWEESPGDAADPGDNETPDPDDSQAPEDTDPGESATPGDSEIPGGTEPGENETPGDSEIPGETEPGENETPGDNEIPGETEPGENGTPGPGGDEDPGAQNPPQGEQPGQEPVDNPRRLTPVTPSFTAGSLALEQSHVPYMIGMGDGTFHPDEELTRAEAIQLLSRLITTQPTAHQPVPFADAVPGSWYWDAVGKMVDLGLLRSSEFLYPDDPITRAEFADLMVLVAQGAGLAPMPTQTVPEPPLPEGGGSRFPEEWYPQVTSETQSEPATVFPDVPAGHWALERISIAAEKGWITGYPSGLFGPDDSLTRCEICAVINRVTGRSGDSVHGPWMLGLGLFSDVSAGHWAVNYIAEASITHTPTGSPETWTGVDLNQITGKLGFREVNGRLAYFDRSGKLCVNRTLGAYTADEWGILTQTAPSYQLAYVPYISQIDRIYAWVGCEPVSALMGLKARGFATDVDVTTFLAKLPTTKSNPEKGFVGSPYKPDKTKKTRTTIYPAILAQYCNTYTGGQNLCADFRGASLQELQRELLAGNPVVCYMTLWWDKPYYRNYNIEGQTQRLVSNNHALLVYGYDPQKGYLCSDPYNYYNRGKVHQYWEPAKVFEPIWNERKVGMVIR